MHKELPRIPLQTLEEMEPVLALRRVALPVDQAYKELLTDDEDLTPPLSVVSALSNPRSLS